jgi:2-amino-4-hydroxy-6-hydroxymethyldihydropteridine diphosphokinase
MEGGIFLLLGSNLGDRLSHLVEARTRIGSVIRGSSVYATGAWGNTEQPEFLNQVLEVSTEEKAGVLLKRILGIETAMGRKRLEKWGTRSIDIDILLYRDEVVNEADLKIPHPEIQNRRFTLEPLCELAPDLKINGKTVLQLLKDCKDPLPVKRLPPQR